jgi:hypothetical protein
VDDLCTTDPHQSINLHQSEKLDTKIRTVIQARLT